MIESYVDLTYRGVSLGRRIKLTQVRPSSGYLELPAPMPVGTQVAIATDDGVTFGATVTWIYEQVAGSDRVPGMVVTPQLAGDDASAWWTSRVALPDEDPARVTRTRPVTARPRSHTQSAPPAQQVSTDRMPLILADLDARVTAAAGLAPAPAASPVPPAPPAPSVPVNAVVEPPPDLEPVIRRTGEHDVVDDGYETVIMQSVDPEAIGLDTDASSDPASHDVDPDSSDAAATRKLVASSDPAPGDGGAAAATGDDGPTDPGSTNKLIASEAAEGDGETAAGSHDGDPGTASPDEERSTSDGGDDRPPARRGWFRRRNKRP